MKKMEKYYPASALRILAGCAVVAVMALSMGSATAQNGVPAPTMAPGTEMSIPDGYTAHHSVDLGGRVTNINGSQAMYDTLVNLHEGPRVLGESFSLQALPGKKMPVDSLTAFGSGFGGDPYNFAKLDAHKGKFWEFSGLFRRDRQYFDYDLLGNPNIVPNTIPVGPISAPSGSIAWGPINHSPKLWNTVRRMTDTSITLFPVSKFSYRFGYSQNVNQGPSLSPSYNPMKYDALLQQYQRNSTDDFTAATDWEPVEQTRVTFEEQIDHWKGDSYFTLDPNGFQAQEADGTKVNLGNWDSETPYGIGACATASMGSDYTDKNHYTVFHPAQTPGGLPVINPACSVMTSYLRQQPTRVLIPTEMLRFQSSSISAFTMAGDLRYTAANMNMPSYYEDAEGLETLSGNAGAIRSVLYSGGHASGHRAVVSADYTIVWQATKTVSVEDQVNYSSAQQPGSSIIPIAATLQTAGAPNQTVTYSGPLAAGNAQALPHGINGTLVQNYFGQSFVTNNATVSWDPTPRTRLALTYRYNDHKIGEGTPHTGPVVMNDPVTGTVEIVENAGILNAAFRPVTNWDVNGSVEIAYADNAFTPMTPRQFKQYRIHTLYKPKPWATISGTFNDRERHNNTNNQQEAVASGEASYYGPLNHVDSFRIGAVNAMIAPNEHYGLDLSYTYTDVDTATNVCFTSGATASLPGTATVTAGGAPNICPGIFARGSTTQLVDFFAREFEHAPTNFGTITVHFSPGDKLRTNIGYRVSQVSGSRFYDDARDVNGALASTYQSPYTSIEYAANPRVTWKAEYNYYGYGENGPSGPELCSTSVSATATVAPCTSFAQPTGLTEPASGLTAPRIFHANNVTLGFHYAF